MIATFLLLGWGFWELSGGAEFEPETVSLQTAAADTVQSEELTPVAEPVIEVTRSNTDDLSAVAPEPTQVSLEIAPEESPVVEEIVQEVVAAAEPEPAAEVAPLDLREVAGSRVNLREGPGTNFGVLVTLDGGTETEVLEVDGEWAFIRIVGTTQTGWMAERLLNQI